MSTNISECFTATRSIFITASVKNTVVGNAVFSSGFKGTFNSENHLINGSLIDLLRVAV